METCAVCITTHNRREELARTLTVLRELSPQADEVIVVADGCSDGTVEFVRADYPEVRLIVHEASRGSIASRNEMARAAESTIMLRLDDDSHPVETDFIARVKEIFQAERRLAVLTVPQRTDEFPETLTATDFGPPHFAGSYANSGAAIRRDVFLELGGYPEQFWHAYEEPDFALRCTAAGWQVRFEPSLTIRHYFTAAQRNEIRTHHRHARNEFWSILLRCPAPQLFAVAAFRIARQFGYAAKRGPHWLVREPAWWLAAIRGIGQCLRDRQPIEWRKYFAWMQLVRSPVTSEQEWNRVFGSPAHAASPMRISFSATNPCHLYPLALEVAELGALGCYYSGYPAWKLQAPASFSLRTHSLRTNIVYGLLKYAPARLRPSPRSLFLWQDHGFDRWVGRHLEHCDVVHAMPGQALETFRGARRAGVRTMLNHATGPVREWVRIMEPEYTRVGLRLTDICPYDDAYFAREDEEYALADFHCAASTVVRDQLIARGIDPARIIVVPYGADPEVFHAKGAERPSQYRIVFAGQVCLRKGLRTLLDALEASQRADWEVHFYGGVPPEAQPDLASYRGAPRLHFHGAVSQRALADAFRGGSVLVLPSLEEGFGLVVPQALNCGLPVIVSDRVGGKDLVREGENGSIVPAHDAQALLAALLTWEKNPARPADIWDWHAPARELIALTERLLASPLPPTVAVS